MITKKYNNSEGKSVTVDKLTNIELIKELKIFNNKTNEYIENLINQCKTLNFELPSNYEFCIRATQSYMLEIINELTRRNKE